MSKKGKQLPLDRSNPNLFFGSGSFDLPNGDKYSGEYCAHRIGTVWREGHGTYTTKEGQNYECDWTKDKIVEGSVVRITYPTGEVYTGPIIKDQYSGPGSYFFDNTMPISCQFIENKPIGDVALIDLNGRLWEGEIKPELEGALLLPENVLYTQLDEKLGKSEERTKYKREKALEELEGEEGREETEEEEEYSIPYRQWEQMIFAKSRKIPSDVDFNEFEWCKKYLKFKQMKSTVLSKMQEEEELEPEETNWYLRYLAFKEANKNRNRIDEVLKSKIDEVQHGQPQTEGRCKKKNIPIPVIYATKSDEAFVKCEAEAKMEKCISSKK